MTEGKVLFKIKAIIKSYKDTNRSLSHGFEQQYNALVQTLEDIEDAIKEQAREAGFAEVSLRKKKGLPAKGRIKQHEQLV